MRVGWANGQPLGALLYERLDSQIPHFTLEQKMTLRHLLGTTIADTKRKQITGALGAVLFPLQIEIICDNFEILLEYQTMAILTSGSHTTLTTQSLSQTFGLGRWMKFFLEGHFPGFYFKEAKSFLFFTD
jgi:hypothetical protein